MNLTTTNKGFRELLKGYDNYERSVTFKREDIPEGYTMVVENYEDYQSVCIYRDHPFNEQVLAAKAAKTAANNSRAANPPTAKFDVADWTPEKLAQMQESVKQRTIDYNAATKVMHAAAKAYNDAVEAQRREITGETT